MIGVVPPASCCRVSRLLLGGPQLAPLAGPSDVQRGIVPHGEVVRGGVSVSRQASCLLGRLLLFAYWRAAIMPLRDVQGEGSPRDRVWHGLPQIG